MNNVNTTIFQALSELGENKKSAALCTVVKTSGSTPRGSTSKMLVYSNGDALGTVGGGELENRVRSEALSALKDGKARLLAYSMNDTDHGGAGVCGGQVEVFVEPILTPQTLVVIGGGHVGKAVAHLAKWLGFHVAVSDDRPEFCTPAANPDADSFYPVPMNELPEHLEITGQTYLVLTTRGVAVDAPGLPVLLDTPAAYIGVIGSRRRWASTVKELKKQGLRDEQISRVHSPIGLELQAETPEEIAVSILAEILMLRDGGSGKPLKDS
ncbi:MAG: XdhC family protein [Anaerolineales bacterium]|nr:XdhC family protein [Anaerolineales bacterium]